jgi:diaminopimelate decarboxylase
LRPAWPAVHAETARQDSRAAGRRHAAFARQPRSAGHDPAIPGYLLTRPHPTITMSHFSYQNGVLNVESTPLPQIAEQFGTPTYVYSKAALLENFAAYADACKGRDALVCYAMKANSNLAILDLLARQGAGFDIVSGGELLRVIAAGGDPRKVIFSGVGKTVAEMKLALDKDIMCFNVESIPELHRLNQVAGEMGKRARVSLRVNPNVDAKTHPYIATGLKANKFGVAFDDALATYRAAAALPHLEVVGIDCHIGSQLLDDAPAKASCCTTWTSAAVSASTTARPARSRRCRSATIWPACSGASTPGARASTTAARSR